MGSRTSRKLRKQAERPGIPGFGARTNILADLITKSKEADRSSREKVATIGASSRIKQSQIQGGASIVRQGIENIGEMDVRKLMESGAGARRTAADEASIATTKERGVQRRLTDTAKFKHIGELYAGEEERKKKKGSFSYDPTSFVDEDEVEEDPIQGYININ